MKNIIFILLFFPSIVFSKERVFKCKNFYSSGNDAIFKHKDFLIKKDEIFIRLANGEWTAFEDYFKLSPFGPDEPVTVTKNKITKEGGAIEIFKTNTDKTRSYYTFVFDFKFDKLIEERVNLDGEGRTLEKGREGKDKNLPLRINHNCQKLKK